MDDIVLVPPVSKSDAQRALVLASIRGTLEAMTLPVDEDLPRDVVVLREGLRLLVSPSAPLAGLFDTPQRRVPGPFRSSGVETAPMEDPALDSARAERQDSPRISIIDCHDGGAPFRFLLAQASVTPNRVVHFVGTERLGERPHEPLLVALEKSIVGLRVTRGTPWPLIIETPKTIDVSAFEVDASLSSQFASSLALAAAKVAEQTNAPMTLSISGALASEGYFSLTLEWLERFGFSVNRSMNSVTIARGQLPATQPSIPGDWSSLTYLLCLAWKAGVRVDGIDVDSAHPDRRFVDALAQVGLALHEGRVTGAPTRGLDIDVSAFPDSALTLAALACVLPAPSILRRVDVLRLKESDRVERISALLSAAGGTSRLDGDTLKLTPPPKAPNSLILETRGDHRVAMAAATAAFLLGAPLALDDHDCVSKSFPGFWNELAKVLPDA